MHIYINMELNKIYTGSGFKVSAYGFDTQNRSGAPLSDITPCSFMLPKTMERVTAIQVTSVEMPNCFYAFRRNVNTRLSFRVDGADDVSVSIPEGNYCADSLVAAVGKALEGTSIGVSLEKSTGRVTFSSSQSRFRLVNTADSIAGSLGFVLHGEQQTDRSFTGTRVIDPVGDRYVFIRLRAGNIEVVGIQAILTPEGNTFEASAKVVLDQPRGSVVFQDALNSIATQTHVMSVPASVSNMRVEVFDRSGKSIVPNSDFSFTVTFKYNSDPEVMR